MIGRIVPVILSLSLCAPAFAPHALRAAEPQISAATNARLPDCRRALATARAYLDATQIATNTGNGLTAHAAPGGPSKAGIANFAQVYTRCDVSPYRNAIAGYLAYGSALAIYGKRRKDWHGALHQAIVHLTKCISDFALTEIGEQCVSDQENAETDDLAWNGKS